MGKVAAFVAILLLIARRVVPWVLHYIAHTGSRELFRLAVLSIALGIAFGAAALFGVSFALGAFFAGMILSESELSHQAAQETLPLGDAFAVLFFVSVGMLLDPDVLTEQLWLLLATLGIILFGKSVAAFVIVRLFGHPRSTALVISASLAQIGEFSFILAGLGLSLGVLPEQAQDLILAGAIISILLNPAFFVLLDRFVPKEGPASEAAVPDAARTARRELTPTALHDHYIVVGHGRVGSVIQEALRSKNSPTLVIEDRAAVPILDGVDQRQRRRSGGAGRGQSCGRALHLRRGAGCVRSRHHRGAGPRRQPVGAHHRPRPFRSGAPASDAPGGDPHRAGRAGAGAGNAAPGPGRYPDERRADHNALISATSRSWLSRVTAAGFQARSASGAKGRAMPA